MLITGNYLPHVKDPVLEEARRATLLANEASLKRLLELSLEQDWEVTSKEVRVHQLLEPGVVDPENPNKAFNNPKYRLLVQNLGLACTHTVDVQPILTPYVNPRSVDETIFLRTFDRDGNISPGLNTLNKVGERSHLLELKHYELPNQLTMQFDGFTEEQVDSFLI